VTALDFKGQLVVCLVRWNRRKPVGYAGLPHYFCTRENLRHAVNATMDPTREGHDHDAHIEAETASNSSESESERNDGSDASTSGGENAREAPSPRAVDNDDAGEDDEDVDSDVETQRIGDSVLRFARCVSG
jgi:hypothetical protein